MRSVGTVAALSVATLVVTSAVAVAPAGAASVLCDGRKATIVGTGAGDVLLGTNGPDVIAGLGGNDNIQGRGGNDIICGGFGSDRLSGGTGNDRLYGGPDEIVHDDEDSTITELVGDQLWGGPGDDRLVPGRDTRKTDGVSPDTLSWSTAAAAVRIHLDTGGATGQGTDTIAAAAPLAVVGSDFGDRIYGSPRADQIQGGAGSDLIYAGAGNDRVFPDDPDVTGGPAADVVHGGAGNDMISATLGVDKLYGGAGNDTIDDLGIGPDTLDGGAGNDLIIYDIADTSAAQILAGDAGNDQLSLYSFGADSRGNDAQAIWHMDSGHMQFTVDIPIMLSATGFESGTLVTPGASWTVRGTSHADTIDANQIKQITFDGLGGNDSLFGSPGNDTFDGGTGTDHSFGMGDGEDTCISVEIIDGADCENVTP